MGTAQKNSGVKGAERKTIRPVLIISERTVHDYSMFLKHLLAGLADESISAALVCRPDCDVESVVSPTTEIMRHPALDLPLLGRRNRRMLSERLEKFRPSVLHCLCESQSQLTRQLAQRLGLPYVLTVNTLRERWWRLSVSGAHCAKIIVPAKSIAANFSGAYPRFTERIKHVNIGTFVEKPSGCFHEPGRLASMVTAYPLNRVEDFENLLRAVRHLVIDGYEFLLVAVGGGRAESELRKLLRGLGLLWIVTIVPRLTAWRSILAAGDIFIQPQPSRAFDPLLLEAMSVGTAVAGCRGGVDDLLIEDKTCAMFDPGDELSIYNSLQRLFDRPEYARQLAQGAQEYLRENHSVSKMVAEILQIYRDTQQWYRNKE
ncbi:MAG: glycosyltransferase family 4 protein, partial [Planctomycetota bacterium]